jgi:hypothetical protein
MDRKYFGPIEKGETKKQTFIEKPITQTIKATYQDPNIQIPMVVASYRTPSMKTRGSSFRFYIIVFKRR